MFSLLRRSRRTALSALPARRHLPAVLPSRELTVPYRPPDDAEPVFVAEGVEKHYGEGVSLVRALAGVNLELYPGELVVILGSSGSGKSTLLNLLGGLDRPSVGGLRFRGWDVGTADDAMLARYRREAVGFVFQFYNLVPSLTARENVALVTEGLDGCMSPEEALRLVEMDGRADHFPSQLSGGQQQRVAIARAIAKRPEVLLCDEPTGALDVKTGAAVLEAIQQVNREIGAFTAIITHNHAIADMADRVLIVSDGRIQAQRFNPVRTPVSELKL